VVNTEYFRGRPTWIVRCFERLEMNRSGEAWWPPLVEPLSAVLTREVAWSWRLDTCPMVDRDALRRPVIVCWEVMNWSPSSWEKTGSSWTSPSAGAMVVRRGVSHTRPSQPVIAHRRGDQQIAHTATDAQLRGCMGQGGPLTRPMADSAPRPPGGTRSSRARWTPRRPSRCA
jgi:hypothetical protein